MFTVTLDHVASGGLFFSPPSARFNWFPIFLSDGSQMTEVQWHRVNSHLSLWLPFDIKVGRFRPEELCPFIFPALTRYTYGDENI